MAAAQAVVIVGLSGDGAGPAGNPDSPQRAPSPVDDGGGSENGRPSPEWTALRPLPRNGALNIGAEVCAVMASSEGRDGV